MTAPHVHDFKPSVLNDGVLWCACGGLRKINVGSLPEYTILSGSPATELTLEMVRDAVARAYEQAITPITFCP